MGRINKDEGGYSMYQQARITRLKLYVRECLVCNKRLKIDQECTHTKRRKLHKGEKKDIDDWIIGLSLRRWER